MRGRSEVEAMLRSGQPFGRIENRIEGMRASEETKSALWLLAWIEQENHARRPVVGQGRTEVLPAG